MSVLFLYYLNVGLSSSVLSPVSWTFLSVWTPSNPLLLHLSSVYPCCSPPVPVGAPPVFLSPAVFIWRNYSSHASPRWYGTASGHSSGRRRLSEHLNLLKTSPVVMSDLHFCLNTPWARQKKRKNSKTRWWKNYMANPQHIQKIPQSPTDALLACIIDQWPLRSPMDSTQNSMMKPERPEFATMGCITRRQIQFPMRNSKTIQYQNTLMKSSQSSNRAPVSNLFPFFLFELQLNTFLFHSSCTVISPLLPTAAFSPSPLLCT